ncbi:hypothetical protein ACJJIO_18815 [Microbulbifer sp. TRSA005]|uniref:hypothetical protein n=1 Tax=Microbulbifer sp. DLAB2-AF TaxID=3243395 RepID=UPI00403A2BEB
MRDKRAIFATVELWCSERKGIFFAILVTLGIGVLFLYVGLPKSTELVSGVAQAQVYDGSQTGNEPKLSVKLANGSLVHVAVSSPGQVKIGSELCLYKKTSHAGTVHYSIKAVGKCT